MYRLPVIRLPPTGKPVGFRLWQWIGIIYDSYAYKDVYTKADVERIVAPLMGNNYKKSDVASIQRMDERDVNNIIYPILDVLDKAGKKAKIDAVILNGGMTKFYLIRKRLKEFFGFDPLTTSDPDLAVARGAVYYHYCLHKYNVRKLEKEDEEAVLQEKNAPKENVSKDNAPKFAFHTGTILNDSINLGLRGEYVSLLIPAGTDLPYKSEEIREFKLDKATDRIGIEMYLGRGKTKNLPNRRISTRTVKFSSQYPAGTPISFQIYLNSMRMMTMEAWITGKTETKTVMEMDMASLKTSEKSVKGIATTSKMKLNAKSELNTLKELAKRNKDKNYALNDEITKLINSIKLATNPGDFYEPAYEMAKNCLQSDPLLGYLYVVAGVFREGWSDSQNRRFLNLAKQHFKPMSSAIKQLYYIQKRALELIARSDAEFTAYYTEYMEREPGISDKLRFVMLTNVVKHETDDKKAAQFLKNYCRFADVNEDLARKLVKRYGVGSDRKNQGLLNRFARMLVDNLNPKKKDLVPAYLPVLVAELCGGEVDNALNSDKYLWKNLKKYLDEETDEVYRGMVIDLFNGSSLTVEEYILLQRYFPEEK